MDYPHDITERYKVCGSCPHHKLIGALHVRSGPGGYREYACAHPEAYPPTDDPTVKEVRSYYTHAKDGRYIGQTEKTPQWCPILREHRA